MQGELLVERTRSGLGRRANPRPGRRAATQLHPGRTACSPAAVRPARMTIEQIARAVRASSQRCTATGGPSAISCLAAGHAHVRGWLQDGAGKRQRNALAQPGRPLPGRTSGRLLRSWRGDATGDLGDGGDRCVCVDHRAGPRSGYTLSSARGGCGWARVHGDGLRAGGTDVFSRCGVTHIVTVDARRA